MKLCCARLEKRENLLPFAVGSRAHVVASTVFGAPETFVERVVGRACCRTGAFLNFYTMKVIGVMSVVLAQAATHVRTIHVLQFGESSAAEDRFQEIRIPQCVRALLAPASDACPQPV